MSLGDLRRRLTRIEGKEGPPNEFGFYPIVHIITRDDADRDRQLAALEAAGEYRLGQFVIDLRIVSPNPRPQAEHEKRQRARSAEGLHS